MYLQEQNPMIRYHKHLNYKILKHLFLSFSSALHPVHTLTKCVSTKGTLRSLETFFKSLLRTHYIKFILLSQCLIKTFSMSIFHSFILLPRFHIAPKHTKTNSPGSGVFDSSEKNAADELSINPNCLG